MSRSTPVVLVAADLDGDGERWWEPSGIAPALRTLGYAVHRPACTDGLPLSWQAGAECVTQAMTAIGEPVGLVAASHGCSMALRVAVEHPQLVRHLVLCWPATGDDPEVDRVTSAQLVAGGATPAAVGDLLDGALVRGVAEHELAALDRPVVVVPAEPEDPTHQRRTVAELRRVLPRAAVGLGTPPPVATAFAGHLGALVSLLDVVLFG